MILSKKTILFLLLVGSAFSAKSQQTFVPDYALNRYENDIRTIEKTDSLAGNPQGRTLFYGSSSFRLWTSMQQDLGNPSILNHGFGGATFPELIHYMDRMILPFHTKTIVIYCENDMFGAKTKSVKETLADYETLIAKIRKKLPQTTIYTLSLKPSPLRRSKWHEVQDVNAHIEHYAKTHKRMKYIDITQVMLDASGKVDGQIFREDSLHLKAEGYQRWIGILKPIFQQK